MEIVLGVVEVELLEEVDNELSLRVFVVLLVKDLQSNIDVCEKILFLR